MTAIRPSGETAPLPPPTEAWRDLLMQRCGLALRDAREPVLWNIVATRRRLLGLASDAAYYRLLASQAEDGAEWVEVVEGLVSHETSFFRHAESFDALRNTILPELRRRTDGRRQVSLCCAGCSTGEEAYSMAMVAMNECPAPDSFTVWASDISHRAIDLARAGRYPERAVARVPAAFRQYFHPVDDAARYYDVVDAVRARVRFFALNLHAAGVACLSYDVIFCQNVLIYLAPAGVRQLVSRLAARLTEGGYLVLGPGDAPLECPVGLEPANLRGVRAFHRTGWTAKEVRA